MCQKRSTKQCPTPYIAQSHPHRTICGQQQVLGCRVIHMGPAPPRELDPRFHDCPNKYTFNEPISNKSPLQSHAHTLGSHRFSSEFLRSSFHNCSSFCLFVIIYPPCSSSFPLLVGQFSSPVILSLLRSPFVPFVHHLSSSSSDILCPVPPPVLLFVHHFSLFCAQGGRRSADILPKHPHQGKSFLSWFQASEHTVPSPLKDAYQIDSVS